MPSDPPSDPPSGPLPMSPEELRAYLGSPDVVAHLRFLAKGRVPRRDVEDALNEAIAKMCNTEARPSKAAVGGWVETSTLNAITDFLRKSGRRGRETAVEDIDELAQGAPDRPIDRLEWLRKRVQKSRIDAETLGMLETQARLGLTRAETAAHFGIEEEALKKRTQRFRAKYEEEWKRERSLVALLVLLALGVVVAIVVLAVRSARRERDLLPIAPEPTPSASAAPPPAPDDGGKNIAAPPSATGTNEDKGPKP